MFIRHRQTPHVGRTLLSVALAVGVAVNVGRLPKDYRQSHEQECLPQMNTTLPLNRKYEYRRKLPHYQKPGRSLFVTFCKNNRIPFSEPCRDAILQHCLYDHGKRYELHAVVIMPEHAHLLLMPLRDDEGWPYGLPLILKQLKGISARSVNKLTGSGGPVWQEESFDHVPRSQEGFAEKLEYIRQNPVRRGLVSKPEDYPWLWVNEKEQQ
jgi:putative transposase